MNGAPCPRCGGQVMSYGRFTYLLSRTATCGSCGGRVRVRYYSVAVASAIAMVALLVLFILRTDLDLEHAAAILLPIAAVAFAVDFSMWRWLGFDVDETGPAPVQPDTTPLG